MSKQMAVNVTFKDSEKWIYDEVVRHSSKGGFIKDVLAEHIRNGERKQTGPSNSGPANLLDSF